MTTLLILFTIYVIENTIALVLMIDRDEKCQEFIERQLEILESKEARDKYIFDIERENQIKKYYNNLKKDEVKKDD